MPSPLPAPHVVLITADELRADALSCYGCEAIDTPNLDRLAAQGTLFRNAYCASPVCLPSRHSIITGQYPHANGFFSNLTEKRMSPDTPNLYHSMKTAGYRTAHIGKCHYTGAPYHKVVRRATVDEEPIKGYYMSLGIDHLDLQNDKNNSHWFWDDYSRELERAGYLEASEWHCDAWVGRKASEYVRTQENTRPNFMWVSFSGPHYPFDPPAEYLARVRDDKVGQGAWHPDEFSQPDKVHYWKFQGATGDDILVQGAEGASAQARSEEEWFQLRRHYYANVALIDEWVGRILEKVEEKWGDNVLVIFTADHGETLGDHKVWGKNRTCYESVFRIPLITRTPTGDYPKETDARVQLVDLMPTLLTQAGRVDLIQKADCDGQDFKAWIDAGGREYVFAEQDKWIAISDGRYKFSQCLTNKDELRLVELYDLTTDPHEFHNLAEDPTHAGVIGRFHGVALDFFLKGVLGRGRLCGCKLK